MKQIIKGLLTISVLLSTFLACSGGEERRGPFSPEERMTRLKERLDLTDEQAEHIKQIFSESNEKMRALRDSFTADRRGAREEMMIIRRETDEKIKAILFDDQLEAYELFQEEQRQNVRRRFQERNRD